MQTISKENLFKGVGFPICIMVCNCILLIWVANMTIHDKILFPNQDKAKLVITKKSQMYHEVPFRIQTNKEEFDSLGIDIIFWTGTEHQLFDSLKSLGIKISSLPKTRKQLDLTYPKVQQSYWLPRKFLLYADGYFIWDGNRMTVFTSYKKNYPTSKIILIGEKHENIFFTQEMYIIVF